MLINFYTYINNSPSFSAHEKTFMMLKPDAYKRHLDKEILMELKEDKGLKITKEWEGIAPREKVEKNWESKRNKSFFNSWMDFMTSGKIKAMVVEGDNAISKVLNFKKKIREKFAPNQKRENLVHSSDDAKSANNEIKNFFDMNI